MLKPEQVPKEALAAFWRVLGSGSDAEAISAAINAWPGMWRMEMTYPDAKGYCDNLILPLPTEASDE